MDQFSGGQFTVAITPKSEIMVRPLQCGACAGTAARGSHSSLPTRISGCLQFDIAQRHAIDADQPSLDQLAQHERQITNALAPVRQCPHTGGHKFARCFLWN